MRTRSNVDLPLALKDCKQAVNLDGDTAAHSDSIGWTYLRMGDAASAKKGFDDAIKLQALPSSLYRRGLAQLRLNDLANAGNDLVAARKLRPSIDEDLRKQGFEFVDGSQAALGIGNEMTWHLLDHSAQKKGLQRLRRAGYSALCCGPPIGEVSEGPWTLELHVASIQEGRRRSESSASRRSGLLGCEPACCRRSVRCLNSTSPQTGLRLEGQGPDALGYAIASDNGVAMPHPRSRRPHHHVYVVELSDRVWNEPSFRRANPDHRIGKPLVYVGMTGLDPDLRFDRHKAGIQANRFVFAYGLRLMPELFEVYNPMPYEAAREMEVELGIGLREAGYGVWQA